MCFMLKVAFPVSREIDEQSRCRRNRENDADAGDDELRREKKQLLDSSLAINGPVYSENTKFHHVK